MYSVTRLLDITEPDRDRVLGELRDAASAAGARHWIVQPTLPGSRNGGDVLLHLRFDTEDQWRSAAVGWTAALTGRAVGRINGADYPGAPIRCGQTAGTIYRSLLLQVQPGTDPATLVRFERDLALMPHYVSSITAWQLSRVTDAVGDATWTHVFEQEFADVDGLMGPYLMHPIHWAVVDRWFDPETTDVIIGDRVCHSFCAMSDSVLTRR